MGKLFIVTGIFFIGLSTALAQKPLLKFDHISTRDGISQNRVVDILQDHYGFMWFATGDGLNRYDGKRVSIYRHHSHDTTTLSDSDISVIFEDSDHNFWVGTGGGGLNLMDRHNGRFQQVYDHKGYSLKEFAINFIVEDPYKKLWIGYSRGKIVVYDRIKNVFEWGFAENPELKKINFTSALKDRQGNIWIGDHAGRLFLYHVASGRITANYAIEEKINYHNAINAIYQDSQGFLWIGTVNHGLYCFDQKNKVFKAFTAEQENSVNSNIIDEITEDNHGNLWIGTGINGLNILDQERKTFSYYHTKDDHEDRLSGNGIRSLYKDRQGNIWIGLHSNGIDFFSDQKNKFKHYQLNIDAKYQLKGKNVPSIFEDPKTGLWVANGGDLTHIYQQKVIHLQEQKQDFLGVKNKKIRVVLIDKQENLWLGTRNNGLILKERGTGKVIHYRHNHNNPKSLKDNKILVLFEDRQGNLLIGTRQGLDQFNAEKQAFIHWEDHIPMERSYINAIAEDEDGTLLIGTSDGFITLNRDQKTYEQYRYDPKDHRSLGNNHIYHVFLDRENKIWLGTRGGGLNLFDRRSRTFERITVADGLSNNFVKALLEDDSGNLWISTNKGISKFNKKKKIFRNYGVQEGLQSDEFIEGACFKNTDGLMYFGGYEGYNVFHPDSLVEENQEIPVYLTAMRLFNRTVSAGTAGSPLSKKLMDTREITLTHDQNIFSFDYAALSYAHRDQLRYAFKLEGLMDDWYYPDNNTATFTNLDPGTYTFTVKTTFDNSNWHASDFPLKITIKPPFWKTNWAYFIYLVLFATIIYLFRRAGQVRERLKSDLKIKKLEAEKMREIDEMKTSFFTNLSHEFRTPLTLILGPLEKLLANHSPGSGDRSYKQFQLMHRNAQRLLRLINQLLDISKLEAGNMKLEVEKANIAEYIKKILASFEYLAERHNINFMFEANYINLQAWFDRDKIEKIVYNLVSNAFKFTSNQGEIKVLLKTTPSRENSGFAESITIIIKDNGIGIAREQLDKVFNRYYQVDNRELIEKENKGTGIGLALTRQLVHLHNGTIAVSSQEGKGTEFTVNIFLNKPYSDRKPKEGVLIERNTEKLDGRTGVNTLPHEEIKNEMNLDLILIVDDSQDIRDYLNDVLRGKYKILDAPNGIKALEMARQKVPDLIVCDILMPELNGMDLCRKIKEDERTSHIPVILLTALADGKHKIEGLEWGADDYITKPFDLTILETRIKNLISLRKKLKSHYLKNTILIPEDTTLNETEERFLNKVVRVIDDNLGDASFNVEQLASALNMTSMQLYRKLRGLTGYSGNEFVRLIRLKKAAQLLENTSLTISEIAYSVGFNDPAYFTRCFKKQFSQSPTEYLESLTSESGRK